MIVWTRALPAGTAVQVMVRPPAGADRWRVLRKAADVWTTVADPDAVAVYEGDDTHFIDDQGLVDGQAYFYAPFYRVAGVWTRDGSRAATPLASWRSPRPDPQLYLRDRLDAGLLHLVQQGVLLHARGRIQVLLGPPALDSVVFPVVTLHLTSDAPAERGIGDSVISDSFDGESTQWVEHDGWLDRVQIAVVGWSLNPDERAILRKALKDLVIANLPLLNAQGMTLVEFQQQDVEDFETFNAPMYQTVGTFTCLAVAMVDSSLDKLDDVQSTLNRD